MYNDTMPDNSYEIRKCSSCGLRYPLIVGHPGGTRCPICMGVTSVVHRASRKLVTENERPPASIHSSAPRVQRAVILDNIRSAWNVGSIFRSADGFGFTHAYVCGITPTPENEAVMKTSLGAEESVSWSYHKDAVILVKSLKKEGCRILCLEEDPRADEIGRASKSSADSALIVGNEVTGVDPELLELCDEMLYILMRGEKKSFNVAVAFGIAAYSLTAK
jgi:23S rRNA (guanosine2251-2'-O)-methyltransferase